MDTTVTVKYTRNGSGGGITIPSVKPTYSDAISDFPEPIESQDVGEPDNTTPTDDTITADSAADPIGNAAETQAAHDGQTLVSTQTVTHEYPANDMTSPATAAAGMPQPPKRNKTKNKDLKTKLRETTKLRISR